MSVPLFLAMVPCITVMVFTMWKGGFSLDGEPIGVHVLLEGVIWGILLCVLMSIAYVFGQTLKIIL